MRTINFGIIGALVGGLFFAIDTMEAYILYLTIAMFFITNILLSDFSDLFIDVSDHYSIVPRPVCDQTVTAARMFHILLHLLKYIIPFLIPAVLIVFIMNGVLPGLIFLYETIAAVCICVFAVNIVYMILLRSLQAQKFRNTISYFQTAFAIAFAIIYLPALFLFQAGSLQAIDPLSYTASYFFPPVWLALLQNWVTGTLNGITYLGTALSLVIPALFLASVVSFLSGNYINKLSQIATVSTDSKSKKEKRADTKKTLSDRLAAVFTFNPLERLGFKITWKLSSRISKFKSRAFSTLALALIIPASSVFANFQNFSFVSFWHQLLQKPFYLFLLYAIGALSVSILMFIPYSEDYKAAWFYQLTSSNKPGLILSGMIKSVFVKYLLLPIAIVLILSFWIWGAGIWLNVIFALINILLITVVMALIKTRKLPFSVPSSVSQRSKGQFWAILLIYVPMLLGLFQWFISGFTFVLIGLSVIYAAITWPLYRIYKNISWTELLEG